jgi:opacity protein-like surface antigen
MKKISLALIAFAGLCGLSTAHAGTSDIKAANNQVGFQLMSTHVDYTETGDGTFAPSGTLDTERGPVPGYALSISSMRDLWLGNDYIEAEYDHASGNTEYVGGYLNPPTPYGSVVGTSGATLTNYSARYGAGFVVNDRSMLTPYLELGHHEWDRGVNLGELYTHNYYGVGVLGQYASTDRLVLSARALFGSTFAANIVVNGAFSGALGNSVLFKAGAGADYALVQNLHATLDVEYTSFNYGISALYPLGGGYYGWEPDSSTKNTTVRIGLGAAF